MKARRRWTRPRSASLRIAGASSNSRDGTMAAIRPPSARQSSAACRCASSAWNGGLTTAAWKLPEVGSKSFRRTASCWLRAASGKRPSSRAERPALTSFRVTWPPHASARIARRPVPAEGSSTRSPVRTWAASTARAPNSGGVENWSSATCSSERREWVRLSDERLASSAQISAGASSSRPTCGARRRSCSTSAASMAS